MTRVPRSLSTPTMNEPVQWVPQLWRQSITARIISCHSSQRHRWGPSSYTTASNSIALRQWIRRVKNWSITTHHNALKPVARIFNRLGDMVKNHEIDQLYLYRYQRPFDLSIDKTTEYTWKSSQPFNNSKSTTSNHPNLQRIRPTKIIKRPSSSTQLVASGISFNGIPYLPYHLKWRWHSEANEQLAFFKRISHCSETIPKYDKNYKTLNFFNTLIT